MFGIGTEPKSNAAMFFGLNFDNFDNVEAEQGSSSSLSLGLIILGASEVNLCRCFSNCTFFAAGSFQKLFKMPPDETSNKFKLVLNFKVKTFGL